MPPTVDYLPVAVAGGSNVDSQANFVGSGYQTIGFTAGIAVSKQLNKVWRQSSMVAACIANFISQTLNINVLDDGNSGNLLANFLAALTTFVGASVAPAITVVAFSANPVFNCAGRQAMNFQITLTGNVVAPVINGVVAGMVVNFIIKQDGAGGHTFAWPGSVPGANIDGTANAANCQGFIADAGAVLHPLTPMTVS
jgi:hypothetical protein